MRKTLWAIIPNLVLMQCFLDPVFARKIVAQEKPEAAMVSSLGNTTFLFGTTWCVARPRASEVDLKAALDWVCGRANCRPIQAGGPCFQPDTLLSHASYAFNNYYQLNGNTPNACNFVGIAHVTTTNPSFGKCYFETYRTINSSSAISHKYKGKSIWRKIFMILLLLYLSRI